jgi:hypothetical protein
MSEINLDWYEYNYLKFDFDGSQHAVRAVWGEISTAYSQFIRSNMIGLDILTLIAEQGGPLENVKHALADMICFFGAGKVGMEKRAEDMAKACVTGGKATTKNGKMGELTIGLQVTSLLSSNADV